MVKQQENSSFSSLFQQYYNSLSSLLKDNQIIIPAIFTLICLVTTSILFFVYKRFVKAKANTILIIGPSGSGKSTIFGKLVNQKNEWSTHSSVQENIYSDYLCKEGLKKSFILVDYPGADTFRKALFNKWFNELINSVCCIIFVVDSATFSKKDVAEYLYDVLYEIKNKMIPLLVVCNKQDLAHAKAGQLIEKLIEQEFGLINISREAALSFTTEEENYGNNSGLEQKQQKILSMNGQKFKFEDFEEINKGCCKGKRPIFVECSAIEHEKENNQFSLNPLREWIGGKCCDF